MGRDDGEVREEREEREESAEREGGELEEGEEDFVRAELGIAAALGSLCSSLFCINQHD